MKTLASASQLKESFPFHLRNLPDANGYNVIYAQTLEERKRIWSFVYQNYQEQGYAEPNPTGLWYSLHDALPQVVPFLITHEGDPLATVTIVGDSSFGLPADTLYKDELDAMRVEGRHLTEVTSLASAAKDRATCRSVLENLFRLSYGGALHGLGGTDLIITVNPHHTFFYERLLLFERVGETRSYGKVNGAPAVLLRLDMDEAPRRYREKYGDDPGSLYAFLTHPVEHAVIRRLLRDKKPRLPLDALHRYFAAMRGEIDGTLGDIWDSLCYA